MDFKTLKIVLVIAALMLMLAGVLSVIVGSPDAQPTPTPNTQIPTASPTPTGAPITPLVTLTIPPFTPTPTITPSPTPSPTPTVTPVPTPTGRELGSGSFRSDTGVPINLVCSWSARTIDSGTAQITVKAELESYSLFVNAKTDALRITVNGSTFTATVDAISTDTTTPIRTELGSHSFTVSIADGETVNVPIDVEWMFEGVYSGVQLDTITASASINLSR